MRASRALAVLLVLPSVALAHRGRPVPVACPADVAAAIAAACPCDGARNHGEYVRCVVRTRNALRRAGCVSDAQQGVGRCAARSTCGRPQAVICCTTVGARVVRDEAACRSARGTSGGRGSACGVCATTTTSTTTSTTVTTSTTTTSTTATTTTSTTLATGTDFGNDVEFPDASAHTPDYLVGSPITVSSPFVLTHLGVIAKAGGPHVMLMLYASAGSDPDQLVASTASMPMTVGRMEIPVAPTQLPAGTYWMMGVYDSDASIGIDETNPNAPDCYAPHLFSDPAPNPFGTSFLYTGQRFNYYIKVQ